MPNKKTITNVPKMLNAFAQTLVGTEYEGLLPVATDTNIPDFGRVMMEYSVIKNRFINQLVNVIAFTKVQHMYFTNPLGFAKRGEIPYGYTIEDIWVDIVKARSFGDDSDPYAMLKTQKPDIKAVFISRNREDFFKQTISEEQLRAAFMSADGVTRLVDTIIDTMYQSNDVTEFAYELALFTESLDNGFIRLRHVDDVVDEASAKSFLTEARIVSNRFLFPSRQYNLMGVMNTSSRDRQRVFITPKADAVISVEALAYAFHLDKAEMLGRITLIDEIPNHPEILAIIADDEFLNVYDNLFKTENFFDGEKLHWQYWLHVWQTLYLSPFHNAVALTTGAVPVITSVTFTEPSGDNYTAGQSVKCAVDVQGTDLPATTRVKYTISGNTATSTYITDDGLLVTSPNETGTIVIKAQPYIDLTKSVEKTLTPA